MNQITATVLAWTELIFEAGRLAGHVDKENEREMEIIGECFGHSQHRSFQGGSNIIIQSREPRSEKWRREILNSAEETKAKAHTAIAKILSDQPEVNKCQHSTY